MSDYKDINEEISGAEVSAVVLRDIGERAEPHIRPQSLSSVSVSSSAYFGSVSSIGSENIKLKQTKRPVSVHNPLRPPRPKSRPASLLIPTVAAATLECQSKKETNSGDQEKSTVLPGYDKIRMILPEEVAINSAEDSSDRGSSRLYSFARDAGNATDQVAGTIYGIAKEAPTEDLGIRPVYTNVEPHLAQASEECKQQLNNGYEPPVEAKTNQRPSVADLYSQFGYGDSLTTAAIYSEIAEESFGNRTTSQRSNAIYAFIDSDDTDMDGDSLERDLISLPLDETHRNRLASLSAILTEDSAFDLLMTYTMETYCVGDLLLWLDLQQYSGLMADEDVLRTYSRIIVRKYLSDESEVSANLTDTLRTGAIELSTNGPWNHSMFSGVIEYLSETLTRIVLPGFFKSPAGLLYAKEALTKAQQIARQSLEDAVIPITAKIIGFRKVYDPTEKFYQYEIEVRADKKKFSVWRRYSEFHAYFTSLKRSFKESAHDLGQFPRKLLLRSQIRQVARNRLPELDSFLQRLLAIYEVRTSDLTLQFFRQTLGDISDDKGKTDIKDMHDKQGIQE